MKNRRKKNLKEKEHLISERSHLENELKNLKEDDTIESYQYKKEEISSQLKESILDYYQTALAEKNSESCYRQSSAKKAASSP